MFYNDGKLQDARWHNYMVNVGMISNVDLPSDQEWDDHNYIYTTYYFIYLLFQR